MTKKNCSHFEHCFRPAVNKAATACVTSAGVASSLDDGSLAFTRQHQKQHRLPRTLWLIPRRTGSQINKLHVQVPPRAPVTQTPLLRLYYRRRVAAAAPGRNNKIIIYYSARWAGIFLRLPSHRSQPVRHLAAHGIYCFVQVCIHAFAPWHALRARWENREFRR